MRSSYFWALAILVAIAGWMLSGDLIVGGQGNGETPSGVEAAADRTAALPAQEERAFRVRVRTFEAEERSGTLPVRGRSEAKQRVTLRAQTAGLVDALAVAKGDTVSAGDLICRLEVGSREANVYRAEAQLAQAEQDYSAATTLRERGHAAETRLRASRAALDAARAALAEAELDLRRTRIVAPFDGVVEERPAEQGALLNVGDACAEIVARDPLLIVAEVSERDVGRLELGMAGQARLVTGEEAEGRLTYIASTADPATRTFRIELEVANPDGRLRAGVTAQLNIALGATVAHRFSPAVLTLADDGRIGVRTLDEDSRVRFMPVEIIADERDSVWVEGLPETITVITVGQDYADEGERVEAVFETADAEP